MSTPQCPNCGDSVGDDVQLCAECGAQLTAASSDGAPADQAESPEESSTKVSIRSRILRSDPVGLLVGFLVAGLVVGALQAAGAPDEASLLGMCVGCVVWMAIARRFPGQRESE